MTTLINVRDLTDEARIRPIHVLILIVCFLTAIVDGVDNQIIGFSAPSIAAALHIPLASFGAVFSAGLIGTLLGAVALGRVADKIGRRRALILCTLVFAVLTVATTLARTATELSVLRFAGGLGLGGAMPGFLTLVSEYAPRKRKALATGLLWCGYPAGGVVGGVLGSQLIPHYGWQAMFYVGGALALFAALLQWLLLPESLQFLALRVGRSKQIQRIARRLAPDLDLVNAEFVADAPQEKRSGIRDVFAEGRALPTVLLWFPLFTTFMTTTFMVLWMPGLFKTAGMSISTAALMLALGNFSTLPSQAASGYLLDRVGPFRVLPVTYALLALFTCVLAFSLKVMPVVAAAMVLIGFLGGPGISGMLFLTTSFYPSRVRSTGVGLAMGIGRSGQVVGSLVIGWLVSRGVAVEWVIVSMAIAPLVALVCVLLLSLVLRGRGSLQQPTAASI